MTKLMIELFAKLVRSSPRRRAAALLLALTTSGASVAPAFAATSVEAGGGAYPTTLSSNDQIVLEQVVCVHSADVLVERIDAWSFERTGGKPQYADVQCRAHRMSNADPVYHVAQCARDSGKWSCGQVEEEIRVRINDRVVSLRPDKINDEIATNALRTIGTAGYFQGMSLTTAIQSPCYMAPGPTKDLIEMSCAKWSVMISFWCPNKAENCPRIVYMHARKE